MVKSFETIQPVRFGSYQLVERLAMGGMAEVYLARPDGQSRLVALKRILPSIAADDEFIAMFIDEAKIAGQLSHPNVAQIFDLGKINNSYFIAMEYVSGHDLRALWDRARGAGGKTTLPVSLACYIVKRICDGLDYAHRRRDAKGRPLGIIHRDVSPQNIIVSYEGGLKIIDFGIAKAANRIVRTQTGILKGKFAYMAPEQARGEPTDHRADIFAIGVILYELLTGERGFKAETDFALLEKVRRVEMPALRTLRPDLPKDLEVIVAKALAKQASDRYAWASALGADLDRFMSDQGYASSKEELGAYLQRTFKVELREEQRRLAAYHALFAANDLGSSSTLMRGSQAVASVNKRSSDVDGTALNDPFEPNESAVATLFEDDAVTSFSKPSRLGRNGNAARADNDSVESDIDASEEDSGVGEPTSDVAPLFSALLGAKPGVVAARGSRPSERHESRSARLDETQLEMDAAPSDIGSAPAPSDAARPALPRKLQVVPPNNEEPKPLQRPKDSDRAFAQSGASTPARAETPRLAHRGAPDHDASPAVRASLAKVLLAVVAGAVIGAVAVAVGIPWIWAGSQAPTVVFVTTPRQAEVRRGDEVLCPQTPCAVALLVGKHELRFRAPGADELSRVVEVKAGEPTMAVEVTLERTRDDVRLETSPPGASVTLDNRPLSGTTPLTLPRLLVGSAVRIKLHKDTYEPLEINRVVDDVTGAWRYDLPTPTTTWTVLAEPADALVVGPSRVSSPASNRLVAPVGKKSLQVRVFRPGCTPRELTLYATGRSEAEQKVVLECKPLDSGLFIVGKRAMQVQIDGVEVSKSAKLDPYRLPAGTWTVLLRARGKAELNTVELRSGESLTLNSRLK